MFPPNFVEQFANTPTPFYYYDTALLRQSLAEVRKYAEKYDFTVHYALKANTNTEILEIVKEYGLGADCVSGGEVQKALEMGFPADHVVFAGVGKSDQEIEMAIDADIFGFNCESPQELEVINEIAQKKGKKARVALRLNPNVEAETHKYITTGLNENKFGINLEDLEAVLGLIKKSPNLHFIGIHFHIGSQITNLENFRSLAEKVNTIQQIFEEHGLFIEHLNLGGGLGINYQNPDSELIAPFEKYFGLFDQYITRRKGQQIHFEIGRAIVGQCGSLISRVLYVKQGSSKTFLIVDAGMTELIRPALYQAHHHIENISSKSTETAVYDVVGPVCESSDSFGKDRVLPITQRGDLVVIRSAGAYGEVMSSFYNLRTKAKAYYGA